MGSLAPVDAGAFPWSTFLINVSGSMALGWLAARWGAVEWVRLLVGAGFLGAYTTMSAFAVEADVLVRDGHAATAGLYVAASVVCGIGACVVGRRLAASS